MSETHPAPLTPEQQAQMDSRALFSAELIARGHATHDSLGRLSVSEAKQDELHEKYVASPSRETFIESTREGQLIASHLEDIKDISAQARVVLGHAMVYDVQKLRNEPDKLKQLEMHHTLGIDPRRLRMGNNAYAEQVLDVVHEVRESLNHTADVLNGRRDLKLSSPVHIRRGAVNGHEDRVENGWNIDGIGVDGSICVVKEADPGSDQPYDIYKYVPVDELAALNPTPITTSSH